MNEKSPYVWVRTYRDNWEFEPRFEENGEPVDLEKGNFCELSDDQIVALLEHGLREGDPVFKPYAEEKGYKLKECLCLEGDFPEWDSELYEILNTKFIPVYGEDWADDMPGWDDSIGEVQRGFADEYPELVTVYEISDDGWYLGVLAVNEGVSVERARNAFVAWAEKGWLQQEV